jgi:SAM-dependent methyltransferase
MDDRELLGLAQNLVRSEPGLWISQAAGLPLSFPDHGHAECYQVEDRSFWFRHRNRCITEVLKRYPPAGALFDVGGGNGYVSQAVREAGFETVLVEPAIEGARFGLSRGLEPVICSTVSDAGFSPGSLPAVGIFDVLEHIEDDVAFLTELRRLLKPRGRLYVTVPAYQWLWSSEDVFAGHFRRYNTGRLHSLLSRVGFRVEFDTYLFSPLPVPIFFLRCLPGYFGSIPTPERHRNEHNPSKMSSTIQWVLDRELGALRAGHSLPFGSSCLTVATPLDA